MSLSSRGARAAARTLRQPVKSQPARRYASHGADHGHGAGESALHADAGVKAGGEGFGKGFYITLAALPLAYLAYTVAIGQKNPLERFVNQYVYNSQIENEKNALHSRMLDQAISDRNMFKENVVDMAGPPLRYPESMNHGSPINVVAGQGSADISKLIEHYAEERRRRDADGSRARP